MVIIVKFSQKSKISDVFAMVTVITIQNVYQKIKKSSQFRTMVTTGNHGLMMGDIKCFHVLTRMLHGRKSEDKHAETHSLVQQHKKRKENHTCEKQTKIIQHIRYYNMVLIVNSKETCI